MRGPRPAQGGGQTEGAQKKQPGARREGLPHHGEAEELERLAFRMPDEKAEMWRDYRIFKAAGLLHQWKRIYAARLPVNSSRKPTA